MPKHARSRPKPGSLSPTPAPALPAELRDILAEAQSLERQQRLEEALVQYMRALALDPRLVHAWLRVAYVFLIGLHWARAIEALDTALTLEPGNIEALRFMAFARFNLGDTEEARRLIDQAASRSDDSAVWVMRAWVRSSIDKDPARTLEVYRDWGRRAADPLTAAAKPLVVTDRDPRRKLKVGYVTADFRRHSVAFFMLPVLEHHDRSNVEVHVFSSGRGDDLTPMLQQRTDLWHEVAELSDEELCEFIRALRIDILVDLSGHTLGQRLLTFARRAAPVQVTWLGFMNTLGMEAMDYRLTDYGICPPGTEKFYSETLFRLECMASYAPPPYAPLCEDPPMLEHGHPTLISLNNSVKVTHEMLCLWARIMEARPDCRLIVMVKEQTPESAQAAMQHRIEAAGLPLDRTFVMHQQPLEQFMELGHIADIALDTAPISGGTTTLHALWMGLPVVTLDAERGIDSSSARILQALGWGHWVTYTKDEYVERALAFMDNPEGLHRLRGEARDRLELSELMSYSERTREIETAYRTMWQNYLDGQVRWINSQSEREDRFGHGKTGETANDRVT